MVHRLHTIMASLFIKNRSRFNNNIYENVTDSSYIIFVEHVIINDVSRLIIYDATKSDANVYICRALNEAGVTEKYFNVSIKGDY